MAHRIEIALKRGVRDPRGLGVVAKARKFLRLPVRSCQTREVYKVEAEIPTAGLRKVRTAFTDPVIARSGIGRLAPPAFDWLIEVGFKPGVTDNVGRTARAVVQDLLDRELKDEEDVYTSIQYFIKGDQLTRENAQHIARDLLANPLIQTIHLFTPDEWANAPIDASVPAIRESTGVDVKTYNLGGSDDELMRISREGILSLSLEEMHAIRDHFAAPAMRQARREAGLPEHPTDVELECIAQTWSEHCKHKIFSARVHYVDENGREEWIDSLFKS